MCTEDRWTTAVFRIASGTRSIEEISTIINMKPTRYKQKGEPYSKRNPKSKLREENLWLLASPLGDQATIEAHIKFFLELFKEKAKCIEALQADCEFDIMCSYGSENGQGGFVLDHELLKGLSTYPVELVVNLYPPEKPE